MSDAAVAQEPLLFNPMSPEFIRDPYPYYHQLRETAPVWFFQPLGFWIATRHADVSFVLRDKRFGKAFEARQTRRGGPEILKEPAIATLGQMMLVQDPPDHTRLRGLVVKAFTARRMEEMRPRIQALVDGLIDKVAGQGRMDVVRDLAYPLPVHVICDMLGIPDEDRAGFLSSSRVSGRLIDPTPMTRAELDAANENDAAIQAYFRDLFARRRREPGDDLTSALVQVEEAGEKLSERELYANIILLFGAGHETTANLIGNGLLALHRHPDQLERLKREPGLMPNAVEEMLRYDSSVQMTSRVAFEDVEVGGINIPKGEAVVTLLGAANRDPAVFPEPDRLDVARPGVRAISFGGGIHYCLGAQLARIEAEIVFNTLFRRLPDLRLDDPDNPEWRPTFTLRGLKALPASW